MRRFLLATATASLLLSVGCQADSDELTFRSIEPVCVEAAGDDENDDEAGADQWTCGEVRTIACEDLDELDDPLELHVELEAGACDDADLQGVDGPFDVGANDIEVTDAASGDVVCTATLEVTDTDAPQVETQQVSLWPPNHKMHEIHVDDCIAELHDCDESPEVSILWASSDEPVNDTGDGNTDADIEIVDAERVQVRSERQGGSNGRVYTLGLEVIDSEGNTTQAECRVVVTHDQSGDGAIDDGAAYTVEWPES